MNPTSQGQTSSAASVSSTIRPRTQRLISGLESQSSSLAVHAGDSRNRSKSPAAGLGPFRGASPSPNEYPSRPASSSGRGYHDLISDRNVLFDSGQRRREAASKTASGSLWASSWTTIQDLASNVLGNEHASDKKSKGRSTTRPQQTTTSFNQQHRSLFGSEGPSQWGPLPNTTKPDDHIGIGSRESREAQVREKRRETMLAANGHGASDVTGRFKRRMSDDFATSSSAPPTEHEREGSREALVYVHRVKPHDTLAGVIIQFNCQPAVFRKANRLWPNDTIQTRRTVVLPVDACGVKGRRLADGDDEVDLLGGESAEQSQTEHGLWADRRSNKDSTARLDDSAMSVSSTSQGYQEEPPWKHDSWVEIDGQTEPVEIARMPRRTLGYFPPRRRKSVNWSDCDTPSASLDIPRSPDTSPRGRIRRTGSASYFAQQLQGPGGVGTLSSSTRSPGPAMDRLNKYLAPHLPNVAPKDGLDSIEDSHASNGLENVGSAIEGWVRKLATKAATIVDNHPGSGVGSHVTADGDLIELSGGLEAESSGTHDLDGAVRGRLPTARGRSADARRKKGD
ncbi:MAG: hypothetical protein M1825_005685 [Sarcosagium campestre]|nr:MAG: hypothetical protein M1825_005685 [Sarcosagium campestre]